MSLFCSIHGVVTCPCALLLLLWSMLLCCSDVDSIGESAFDSCPNLAVLTFAG